VIRSNEVEEAAIIVTTTARAFLTLEFNVVHSRALASPAPQHLERAVTAGSQAEDPGGFGP